MPTSRDLENFSSLGKAGDKAEFLVGGFGGYRQAEMLQLLVGGGADFASVRVFGGRGDVRVHGDYRSLIRIKISLHEYWIN